MKPTSDDGIWKKKILEFIHATIVNKLVNVRVEDNIDDEYIPCSITVGPLKLNKVLVAEKLAQHTDDVDVKIKLPDTYDFYKEIESFTAVHRDIDCYKESNLPLEDFKEIIAKKNEAKKEKEFVDQFYKHCSIDYVVEDSDVEFKRNNSLNRDSLESEIDFDPMETSTTISTAMKSFNLLPFTPMKLPKDITKFPCKIFEVLDPLHVFVEPIIEKYSDQFNEMEKKVKKASRIRPDESDFQETRVCLAPYSEDNCYYRAIIKDRISKTQVRVQYVDYLNEEIVDRKSIRECPDDLVKKPLKHLLVKLDGIKVKPRIRESDIMRHMDSLLGRNVIAVIVRNDIVPSVLLYDNDDSNNLAYQSLIDLNFFTKTKD